MYPREGDWFAPLPMGIHTVGTWTWGGYPVGTGNLDVCLPLPWGGRHWGGYPVGRPSPWDPPPSPRGQPPRGNPSPVGPSPFPFPMGGHPPRASPSPGATPPHGRVPPWVPTARPWVTLPHESPSPLGSPPARGRQPRLRRLPFPYGGGGDGTSGEGIRTHPYRFYGFRLN